MNESSPSTRDFFGLDSPILWFSELTPERTVAEVRFCIEETEIKPPDCVLDLACGYGRHAIEFAKAGFQVTAIDQSAHLIEAARSYAFTQSVNATFEIADVATYRAKKTFPCVTSLWTGLGYHTHESDVAFLHTMRLSLSPFGRAVLDLTNREFALDVRPKYESGISPKGTFEIRRKFFDSGSIVEEIFSASTKEGLVSWKLRQHLYTWQEAILLVSNAGFTIKDQYGDFDHALPNAQSPRIILILS